MIGRRFGSLVVTAEQYTGGPNGKRCDVVCDCGVVKNVAATSLLSRHPIKSCGCKTRELIQKSSSFRLRVSLVGQEFNRFIVIYQRYEGGKGAIYGVLCICGTFKEVDSAGLRKDQSCGCMRMAIISEKARERWTTHGLHKSSEYSAWAGAKSRCFYTKHPYYSYYGGRGIRMCQGWRDSFESFYADNGPKPSPELTLDRKNNDGYYSCGHCSECIEKGWPMNTRWATRRVQVLNRRPFSEWGKVAA